MLEDYRDFIRLRGIEEWPKHHSHTRRLRQLNRQHNAGYETFKKGIEHADPAIAASRFDGSIRHSSRDAALLLQPDTTLSQKAEAAA